MAGVITTGNHPKALWPGIKQWWGRQYAEHAVEYTDLFDVVSSEKNYEEYVQATGFGLAPRKSEGNGVAYDSEVQGFVTRIVNVSYGLGYIVSYEERQDNLYEIVSKRRAMANAFSMRQTVENVCANTYNRAFNSSFVGADGVSLLNTAHPNTSGGTFSNKLAVDADLSEAALEDIIIQIMGVQNDRGLFINLMPRSLLVSRQEWFNANRILKSVYQPGNNNNDINVLKATNALPGGIKLNHYFTAPHAWFVRTNVPQGTGLIYQDRQPIMFDQDNDFDTMNAKAKSFMRFAVGYADPRCLFGSNGP